VIAEIQACTFFNSTISFLTALAIFQVYFLVLSQLLNQTYFLMSSNFSVTLPYLSSFRVGQPSSSQSVNPVSQY
jgi:hypothetical protein